MANPKNYMMAKELFLLLSNGERGIDQRGGGKENILRSIGSFIVYKTVTIYPKEKKTSVVFS